MAAATTTTCADISGATSQDYSPQLADQGKTLRLRVTATNGGGSSTATSAAVGPVTAGAGNTPPVPVIDTPEDGFRWKAGDNITFTGHATDAEDGDRARHPAELGRDPRPLHHPRVPRAPGGHGARLRDR